MVAERGSRAAGLRAAGNPDTFVYCFDWDEEPQVLWLDLPNLLGAAHALEIPFVFGFVRRGGSMTPDAYAAGGGGACRDYPIDAYPWTP